MQEQPNRVNLEASYSQRLLFKPAPRRLSRLCVFATNPPLSCRPEKNKLKLLWKRTLISLWPFPQIHFRKTSATSRRPAGINVSVHWIVLSPQMKGKANVSVGLLTDHDSTENDGIVVVSLTFS